MTFKTVVKVGLLLLCLPLLGVPIGPCELAAQQIRVGEIPADATTFGGTWRSADGGIEQSQLSKQPALLVFGKNDQNDFSLKVTVQLTHTEPRSEAGLVFHVRDSSNYLSFTLLNHKRGPYAVLRIRSEGTVKELVGDQSWQQNLDLAAWNELRVDVHGAEVIAYVNGGPAAGFSFEGTPPAYNSHGKTWNPDPTHGQIGLIADRSTARFKNVEVSPLDDFTHIVTPQHALHDANGLLLPRQSYAETMQRFADWMLQSEKIVDNSRIRSGNELKEDQDSEANHPLRKLPPYLLSNFIAADDSLWGLGGEFAFNHALLIEGAVEYYLFSGDQRYLEIARNVADWHLANRTPPDWAFPHAPPSVVNFQDDGSWKGQDWGLEVDKSSYMGLAYLKLFAVTGEKQYFEGAEDIASTLRQYQAADGSWPFRINAQTGEVQHGYACSQLWHVWFFEALAEVTGNQEDLVRSKKAFQWLMENPVKTNKWIGLYGDIPSGSQSYDQWVALETVIYLLDHRDEIPGAVEICEMLLKWVEENLVVAYGFHPDVPGILEQSDYKVVLTHHQLRLAETYAKFFAVTGDPAYKTKAIQAANSVTWCQMSDGKIRQGFWYHAVASPSILNFNKQFIRIMSCIPETAPRDEDHLLSYEGLVRDIAYNDRGISYSTVGKGAERFELARAPKAVQGAGQPVTSLKALKKPAEGWYWNPDEKTLDVCHEGESVHIVFE